MRLYEYLEENIAEEYPWEEYAYEEAEIHQLEKDFFLLCRIWDEINQWALECFDQCRGIDASLIIRILNATLLYMELHRSKAALSLEDAEELCCLYGRCSVFAKNSMCGSEYFEKCKLLVNNTISECIIRRKRTVAMEDLIRLDPEEDEWDEI